MGCEFLCQTKQLDWHRCRADEHLTPVRAHQGPDIDVTEGNRRLTDDDAHHLLWRDAVRSQCGDKRSSAGPYIDIKLVDIAVNRKEIKRAQSADFIDATSESTTTEHERSL